LQSPVDQEVIANYAVDNIMHVLSISKLSIFKKAGWIKDEEGHLVICDLDVFTQMIAREPDE